MTTTKPKPTPPRDEAFDAVKEVSSRFPELNMGNYTDEDVYALNNWGIEITGKISELAAASVRQEIPAEVRHAIERRREYKGGPDTSPEPYLDDDGYFDEVAEEDDCRTIADFFIGVTSSAARVGQVDDGEAVKFDVVISADNAAKLEQMRQFMGDDSLETTIRKCLHYYAKHGIPAK